MVVGITLATIAVLRGGGKRGEQVTFIDPTTFRETIEGVVADPAQRRLALDVVDSMRRLGEEYDDCLRSSVDRYLRLVPDYDATPAKITKEVIQPLEDKRREVLMAYVEARERLREVLRGEEWEEVFGEPRSPDGS